MFAQCRTIPPFGKLQWHLTATFISAHREPPLEVKGWPEIVYFLSTSGKIFRWMGICPRGWWPCFLDSSLSQAANGIPGVTRQSDSRIPHCHIYIKAGSPRPDKHINLCGVCYICAQEMVYFAIAKLSYRCWHKKNRLLSE